MKSAANDYSTVLSNAESFTNVANQLSSLLRGLDTQRKQLDDSLRSLAQLFNTASESLPQIQSKILQLTEQMTFGVKHHQDELTKTIRDGSVSLRTAVSDVKKLLLETTQTNNQEINAHIKELSGKTTEELRKLDVALDKELTKALSTLGSQLASLSKKFVDDYGPLTQRLREVVRLVPGA
jgi:chromosome segregation ATPase